MPQDKAGEMVYKKIRCSGKSKEKKMGMKIYRQFDENKIDRNGADRYFAANAGNAGIVESKLKAK